MKSKLAILGLIMTMATLSTFAQNKPADFGPDSVDCRRNLYNLQEYAKQKAWADAFGPWEKAITTCPGSSGNIYNQGSIMFKTIIPAETDPDKKKALIDKAMMMYDTQIEHFGNEGYTKSLKAIDYYTWNNVNHAEALVMFSEVLNLEGDKTIALALYYYYQALYYVHLTDKEKVPVSMLLNEYVRVDDIVGKNLSALDRNDPKNATAIQGFDVTKESIDSYFVKFAECDEIVKLYREKITAAPDDVELKRKR